MRTLPLNLGKEIILLDGGMGSTLIRRGIPAGTEPALLSLTRPDAIESIHRAYVDAGSQIILTNTFGANRLKLAGTGAEVAKAARQSVAIAKNAAQSLALTALDVGPIGELLRPAGRLSFDEAADIYSELIKAGAEAGADLIFIETISDLYEMKAAVIAAKEACDLPIFASMTFEESGRTFLGAPPAACAVLLTSLGVSALGVNCSLGPASLAGAVREMAAATRLPIIAKPNAGLPSPEGEHEYTLSAEAFAAETEELYLAGASVLGGCCGSSPEYIAALKAGFSGRGAVPRSGAPKSAVCSGSAAVFIDTVRVIGERINPTGKAALKEAIRRGDMGYIQNQAVSQVEAGAEILDVNVSLPGTNESKNMEAAIEAIQSVVSAPLQIDSTNPACIERALRICNGKPILNSVNGDAEALRRILPLVKKYGAAVVGLTLDENGIPDTAEGRFEIAARILSAAEAHGIPKEDVFIDCLTLTVSAEQKQADATLRALELVTRRLGLQTVLGVSNISFGLPARETLNLSFLTCAMSSGLTLPIVNPAAPGLMGAVRAFRVLTCADPGASEYIAAFESGADKPPGPALAAETDIKSAVMKGLAADARRLCAELIKTLEPVEIVNTRLIPALDAVGEGFESGRLFLPQLLQSAEAAKAAFEVIKESLSGRPAEVRGRIILATVRGDIHDIGKNIVKVILENYGYEIIDLGRDVPPETVVEAAKAENIRLVGLSALMTTTLPSMERTIRLLKEKRPDCLVFVGGAVLTKDYAEKIGADFYARDAKASVDYAKKVFSDGL
ncbi:MAG: homocysteine S-methyltransferase family protein [Clostridiales bacterium]|jgi:5-methyltetrahydrofolate--homocysteine methyltransferase|nr:homocysteine S-methyltransferase family protein [Clostridiales bacterium]